VYEELDDLEQHNQPNDPAFDLEDEERVVMVE